MEAREHSAVTQECQPMSMHGGDLIHPITHLLMSTGALSTNKVRGTHELSARIRQRRKMISQQLSIRVCDGTPPSKRFWQCRGTIHAYLDECVVLPELILPFRQIATREPP